MDDIVSRTAIITQKAPFSAEIVAGKTYFWCACGRSTSQPFCDGSHKGSGLAPVKYEAQVTKTAYFCGCKQSTKAPMCDGTHQSLA